MATNNAGAAACRPVTKVHGISRAEDERRRALYAQGLSDAAIGQELGIAAATVASWRKKNGLGRTTPVSVLKVNGEEEKRRRALHAQGKSDSEMAKILGIRDSSVRIWRIKRGLTRVAGRQYVADKGIYLPIGEMDNRRELYVLGLSDSNIAKRVGRTRTAIVNWRIQLGLPSTEPKRSEACGRHLSAEERAARMLLYQLGYSDRAIALQQSRSITSVARWREALGLSSHGWNAKVSGQNYKRADSHRAILRRIKQAIGGHLARDIADDACSDMMLAIMSGKISIDAIEKTARKHGNRVLDQYASKWGARSLDETISGTEDFTLMDTLVDEGSSSWLEEMGATVW